MVTGRRLAGAVGLAVALTGCGAGDPTLAEGARACMSAQALSAVAANSAYRWATDAYLIQAEGFRLDGTTRLSRQPGSRWEFRYLSVRRGQWLSVTIPAQGEIIRQPGPFTTDTALPVRPGANWRIDSDRALSLAHAWQPKLATGAVERITLRSLPWDGRRYRLAWVLTPNADLASQPVVVDASNGDRLQF